VSVVDGGECEVGVESTILGIDESEQGYRVTLLRPGMISISEILSLAQKNNISVEAEDVDSESMRAPGQMKEHYQPDQPLVLLRNSMATAEILDKVNEALNSDYAKLVDLELPDQDIIAARVLYSQLRLKSKANQVIIYNLNSNRRGDGWSAIDDRLKRAARLIL